MSVSPAEHEARRAADAQARHRAQRQFDAPLVIEAGAGTGKTATLVARVLAWCLGPGWEKARAAAPEGEPSDWAETALRRVVAITFTEAAAAEMDTRIEEALAQLARGEPPVAFDVEAPPDRVESLRAALDHLSVQTIHAWCRRLLADHPLEAGVHPLFEVDADGAAREVAVREVAAERLGAGYAARDPGLLALAELGIGPGEIERTVVAQLAAGVGADALAEDPCAPERVEALRGRLLAAHHALEAAGGGGLGLPKLGKGGDVEAALARALTLLAEPVAGTSQLTRLLAGLIDAWEGSARNALGRWRKPKFNQSEQETYAERMPDIAAASSALFALLDHMARLDPGRLSQLAPVLAALAAEVEERLRRSGRLGFDDLLTRSAALLARPEVVARAQADIDQLLVDEFQDTDPRQCAIVAALALEGPAERRPGLFLVGDPKQSIYGWRSADLAAYEDMVGKACAAGGRKESLCVNHRSVPAVLDAVEAAVAPVMQREPGLQPAFQGLAVCDRLADQRGFAGAGRAPIELWIPARCDADGAPQPTRAYEAAVIEAAAVARDLRALHDEADVPWREVGLLFRSRGEWDVYLGELRRAGIPYRVEGDRSYYRRREVLDAAALLCGVLDPNDALSLVTLLRSSAAGVPDAAWIPLWEGGLPALAARLGEDEAALAEADALIGRVAAGLDAGLPGLARVAGWPHAARACLEAVAVLRRSFESEAGDRFVERLRALTAFEGVEAGRFLGRWRSANLERLFAGCAADLAAAGSPDAVLRSLRRAVAEEEVPSVEPAVLDVDDAVSVVTLHGAKGLAWSHVYLLQLHKGSATQLPPDEAGRVDGRFEARWCGTPTLGCDALTQRQQRVAEAERVRTFYVGMTRAKQRLVLSGVWPQWMRRSGAVGNHAELLAQGAGAGIELEALADAADAEGRVEHAGWQWVFAGRAAAPVAEGDESAPVAPSPGAGALPTGAAEAAAPEPADARARMARRRGTTVTAVAKAAAAEGEAPAAEGEAGDAWQPREGSGSPGAARHLGTAVHAALERLDLEAPREAAWPRERDRLAEDLRRALPGAAGERAAADAVELWDALASGPLAERLADLAPRVVARELPLLLPLADLEAGAEYASGAIDLLYRDTDGRLVVVDYKTDRRDAAPQGPGPAEARAAYARQGALYCAAVGRALAAPQPPRFELWWLRSGEIESASDGGFPAGVGPEP